MFLNDDAYELKENICKERWVQVSCCNVAKYFSLKPCLIYFEKKKLIK